MFSSRGKSSLAVAAETKEIAEEACKAIVVDYTPLPAVFDCKEALQTGAPVVHPDMATTSLTLAPNIVTSPYPYNITLGDINKGKQDAEVTLSDSYYVSPESHYRPETNNAIAYWDADQLLVWVTTQGSHGTKNSVTQFLGLTDVQVQV